MGLAYSAVGDFKGALDAYNGAIALDQKNVSTYNNRCYVNVMLKNYDRAISETVGDFAGFVAKYMGDGGAGLFRVTYHRLGTLRARWHCAVPGPSTQATAHSVCVPHRIQPGDYDNKSLPFSRFSTSGGPKLSIRAPIVIPLVGSVGGLKLFATAAMENNLSTS